MRKSPESNTNSHLGNRARLAALLAMTLASCSPQQETHTPNVDTQNSETEGYQLLAPSLTDVSRLPAKGYDFTRVPIAFQKTGGGMNDLQGGIKSTYTDIPSKEEDELLPVDSWKELAEFQAYLEQWGCHLDVPLTSDTAAKPTPK